MKKVPVKKLTRQVMEETIQKKIIFLRGHRVLMDRDLAQLYGVTVKRLNEQVKRNLQRFPKDFMFQLSASEYGFLRSQFATLEKNYGRGKHLKYLPHAFTEQGVAMLSGVLNSPRAIDVNIAIMRTFVKLRHLLESHKELRRKIEEMEQKYDGQFKVVFEAIRQLLSPPEKFKRRIGFHP